VVGGRVIRLPDTRFPAYCEESGGSTEEVKEIRSNDEATGIKKNSKKKTENGSQAKDPSLHGVIMVEGCQRCKYCGNSLQD